MIVGVVNWRTLNDSLFADHGLPYKHGQEFEGDVSDAIRIAGECVAKGLNVMISHCYEEIPRKQRNGGPEKRLVAYMVAVDTFRFQQR